MIPALTTLAAVLQTPTPWLVPYLSLAQQVSAAAESRSVAAALNSANDMSAVRFADASEAQAHESYESFIFRTGCVPTRDNLHDLFNGLVWLCYPKTKQRLNALQAREIARLGSRGTRGELRDALTLFDENAAVLRAPAALIGALRRREWRSLFAEQRALWDSAHLVLFGHALMEKLLQPRKAITAHVWLVEEVTDDVLASSLAPERLVQKPFLPLPVLGVPGWWAPNEEPGFYEDAAVFRP
jgi:hypothetical protein